MWEQCDAYLTQKCQSSPRRIAKPGGEGANSTFEISLAKFYTVDVQPFPCKMMQIPSALLLPIQAHSHGPRHSLPTREVLSAEVFHLVLDKRYLISKHKTQITKCQDEKQKRRIGDLRASSQAKSGQEPFVFFCFRAAGKV